MYLLAATLSTSAFLLFAVQPMVGKMVLPTAGGAPAAWSACLFFFQAALLGGAVYAHASARRLRPRLQAVVHLGLMLGVFALLPVDVAGLLGEVASHRSPPLAILRALLLGVALPVVTLAATTPLLQGWLVHSRIAADPFRLFAASNAGSFAGLLAYPIWIEPRLGLGAQTSIWSAAYVLLLILVAGSAILTLGRSAAKDDARGPGSTAAGDEAPTTARRLRWVLLAAVPSSLIVSVTAYLSANVAASPLLWVVPLALYLVTWILAFAAGAGGAPWWAGRGLALLAGPLLVAILTEASEPAAILLPLHLGVFFLAAWACHGELNRTRPAPDRVAELYLWIALGGALGGLMTALVAPLVFPGVSEYPLGLVAACALRAESGEGRTRFSADLVWAVFVALLTASLILAAGALDLPPGRARTLAVFLPPALLAYRAVTIPRRLALGFAAILLAAELDPGAHGRVVFRERNFFGVVRVTRPDPGDLHVLVHGRTVHGRQSLAPDERARPLSYYHPAGPFGALMRVRPRFASSSRIAVIGLGTGAMAAYARPGEEWTFYEIDPAIARVAADPALFTYLRDMPARRPPRIVLGDARLRLAEAPERSFELLVVDAFSSDSIPVHLLTREAFTLYRSRLVPGGWLVLHVSSRLLDLEPVVASLARDAGAAAWIGKDGDGSLAEPGHDASAWALVVAHDSDLGGLEETSGWRPATERPETPPWTDDFSSLWSVIDWR